ncbi:MAG: DUF2752 domain-containing protein [Phycisphaerales bacterium]|nr:MAG: DUF2752 domain-containing protein [Phycisphaerales bacterium]
MPENCISISSSMSRERRSVEVQANEYHVLVLILCILVLLLSFLLHPGDDGLCLFGIEWPISCALYENSGIKCALCGLTRSFCSIAAGNFAEATRCHVLGPAVFAFVCVQIAYRLHALRTAGRENRKLKMAGIYSAIVLAVLLLINWFVYLGGLVL